jgi:uncharacterized protein (DUF3820 family)
MSIAQHLDMKNPEHVRMLSFVFPSGKHKGKTILDVYDTEHSYCEWLQRTFNVPWSNDVNRTTCEFDKLKYEEETKGMSPVLLSVFPFGKYKNRIIANIVREDPEYCEWILQKSPVHSYQNWMNVKHTIRQSMLEPVCPSESPKENAKPTDKSDSSFLEFSVLLREMSVDDRMSLVCTILDNTDTESHAKLAYAIWRMP